MTTVDKLQNQSTQMYKLIARDKYFRATLSGTQDGGLKSSIEELTKQVACLKTKKMPTTTRIKFVPVSTIATIVFPILRKWEHINLLVSTNTKDLLHQLIYGDTLYLCDYEWNLTADIKATSEHTLRNDIPGFISLDPYMQDRVEMARIGDRFFKLMQEQQCCTKPKRLAHHVIAKGQGIGKGFTIRLHWRANLLHS